ncbi:hypothetical protein MRX96_038235 [Rhipicephalus microplus]
MAADNGKERSRKGVIKLDATKPAMSTAQNLREAELLTTFVGLLSLVQLRLLAAAIATGATSEAVQFVNHIIQEFQTVPEAVHVLL